MNAIQKAASDAMRHLNNAEYGAAVEAILALPPTQAVYVTALLMDGMSRPYATRFVAEAREAAGLAPEGGRVAAASVKRLRA